MNEETQSDDIRKLGFWLLGLAGAAVVGIVIYAIYDSGPSRHATSEAMLTADDGQALDLGKLHDEAQATPTPESRIARAMVNLVAPQVEEPPAAAASQSPAAQHTPSAYEQWKQQEEQKARESSPILTAFEPKPSQVKEIPNLASRSPLHPPASPWTITEGSVINAILKDGVNSDYPGDIVAQIERPLYDSATGRYLLIPAGSTLIGKFGRAGGPFQERIAIGWHRLMLPNQWSMDLPQQMPSTDAKGYAGIGGDVNHHYLSTFGTAALVSLLNVGGSIGSVLAFGGGAVSPYSGGLYQPNPMDQIATLTSTQGAQQMSATSNRFLQPRLNRPNTVTIPPGTRFDVFVDSDLIFPGPYSDTAGQLINAAQR